MSINLGKDIAEQYEKVMSISGADFARSIARMPGAESAEIATDRYRFVLGTGAVVIHVTPMDDYVIKGALLALPRHRVSFQFTGCDQETRNDFIAQFDSRFQRGGG